ncbi:hypothetical protein BDZ90DRAFT_257093 [Jaminaea rosea]|uniref:Nuclear rim protein 1 n=1 Tax=Jaminaea rosea TaxID=1569628 RepID=A0A316V099_9BASI|nr:hypothetical protein BDZ90DRAFT_257093 [Jaminaea rosea]PWN29981.1 hypothetical protein BDZ90DRAFT_257093 [Jaminaea rosea]
MATPRKSLHKSRSGMLRAEAASGSSSMPSSPLARSSSTPYHLYTAAKGDGSPSSAASSSSMSPFISGSPYASSPAARGIPRGLGAEAAHSPVRRKGTSFGSPGMKATSTMAAGGGGAAAAASPSPAPGSKRSAGRKSNAFIRRKTWQQKLQELPTDVNDRLASLLQTVEESLHEPALGYPIGIALHVISLVSHLISPESDLSLSLLAGIDGRTSSRDSGSLFSSSVGGGSGGGGRRSLRRTMQINRAAAWSWTASVLSLALIALSLYNAYLCLSSRRRYRLWMKSADSKVSSQNARLVPIHLDEEDDGHDKPRLQERFASLILSQLQRIPLLGALVPNGPYLGSNKRLLVDAQIHELHIWQPPPVTLRVLTIYSPLSALLWHIVSGPLLPVSGFVAWVIFFVLMQGGLAVSLVGLATLFEGLVRDKELLAAEVMREYDEKFVLPRAMPAVRDASTMTTMTAQRIDTDIRSNAASGSANHHRRADGDVVGDSTVPTFAARHSAADGSPSVSRMPYY